MVLPVPLELLEPPDRQEAVLVVAVVMVAMDLHLQFNSRPS